MVTSLTDDPVVALLCDLALLSVMLIDEVWLSHRENQLSSDSTGESLNSNELRGEVFGSANTSNPSRKCVSVERKGRKVIGKRCCSSNVYRVLCGEDELID